MTTPFPRWLAFAVAAVLATWVSAVWWGVTTLPASAGDSATAEDLAAAEDQVAALATRLDEISTHAATLEEERDDLAARLDQAESARAEAEAALAAALATPGPTAEPTPHPLFTDGEDRYNCKDLASLEQAREVLRINGPGDPNHIDGDRDGQPCEDHAF